MTPAIAALSDADWPYALYMSVLLAFVAGSYLFTRRFRLDDVKAIGLWLAFVLVLVAGYAFRDEGKFLLQRVFASLMPGYVISQNSELVVVRGADGMFNLKAEVNGAAVNMTFDTGASAVTLTAEDAARAGFNLQEGDFTSEVHTANGTARAAIVTLGSMQIGGFSASKVRAMVAKPGALDQSLLGHTFLDRLTSYEVRGDRLILKYN